MGNKARDSAQKKGKSRIFSNPTMKDVAEHAGVSVSTVSHVLNKTRFVSPEATVKVEKAVAKLNFKTNPIARNLRSGKSALVGFVVCNLENYFYVNMARGIEEKLTPLGYQLMIIESAENKEREIKNIESLYLRGAEGIIVAPSTADCGYLSGIVPPDFPLVFVDRAPVNYQADCVLLDNFGAGYSAAACLAARDRKKIAFISFHYGKIEIDQTMWERINGYKQALADAGIAVRNSLIKAVPGSSYSMAELKYAKTYRLMKELLAASADAVICGNSLSATGAFTCLQEAGARIPEDIAFITFDDDVWTSLAKPKLTVVAQPTELIGSKAAQRLLLRIEGKKLPFKTIRLKSRLIVRDSC
jgi:LacI family transcriptional regulator